MIEWSYFYTRASVISAWGGGVLLPQEMLRVRHFMSGILVCFFMHQFIMKMSINVKENTKLSRQVTNPDNMNIMQLKRPLLLSCFHRYGNIYIQFSQIHVHVNIVSNI